MAFWRRLGEDGELLIDTYPCILERGKKKRLAGGVISPPAMRSRCVVVQLPKWLMVTSISRSDRRPCMRNWRARESGGSFELPFSPGLWSKPGLKGAL
jgi:hypothetical protein